MFIGYTRIHHRRPRSRPVFFRCRQGRENGYTGPDPAIDLSGMDVAQALLRMAGWNVPSESMSVAGLVPDAWIGQPLPTLWSNVGSRC